MWRSRSRTFESNIAVSITMPAKSTPACPAASQIRIHLHGKSAIHPLLKVRYGRHMHKLADWVAQLGNPLACRYSPPPSRYPHGPSAYQRHAICSLPKAWQPALWCYCGFDREEL